ncbi:unnamed protein product [Orchesella dallaii]|uniref:Gustatory receptor n=1 Tax=Orchesella dallaii TaxID=48710 RepID=A0ABP1RV64_9HEXA
MLLSSNLLKAIRENISLCDYFGGIPFKWNKISNRMEVRSEKALKIYGVRLYLAFLYKLLVIVQVVYTWKKVTMSVVIHNVMFVVSYIMIGTAGYVFYIHAHASAGFFNNMVEYEERHYTGKHISKSDLKGSWVATWMVRLMTSTGLVTPVLYHVAIIGNPCFPIYLGYFLCDQCNNDHLGQASTPTWSAKELGTKIGIMLLSYVNWNLLMTGITFFSNVPLVVVGNCFRNYIARFGRDILSKKELTSNGTLLKKETVAFRELQLMSIAYREIYSKYLLAVLMICFTLMQIVCLYNTITVFGTGAWQKENFQIGLNLLYFWCAFVAMFMIVVIFGMLADVYCKAKQVDEDMNGTVSLKTNKWFRKFLKSAPVLRVYLCGTNFLDEMTPLTCEDFAIGQTVSILLLK